MSDNKQVLDPLKLLKAANDNADRYKIDKNESPEVAFLRSMDQSLKQILRSGTNMSMSDASNSLHSRSDFRDREQERRRRQSNNPFEFKGKDEFSDGIRDALIEEFLGKDFKKSLGEIANDFADTFGFDLATVRRDAAKILTNQALSMFKGTDVGKKFSEAVDSFKENASGKFKEGFKKGIKNFDDSKKGEEFSRANNKTASSLFDDFLSKVAEKKKKEQDVKDPSSTPLTTPNTNVDKSESIDTADTNLASSQADSIASKQPVTFNIESAVLNIMSKKDSSDASDKVADINEKSAGLSDVISNNESDDREGGPDPSDIVNRAMDSASDVKDGIDKVKTVSEASDDAQKAMAGSGSTMAGGEAASGIVGGLEPLLSGLGGSLTELSVICPELLVGLAAVAAAAVVLDIAFSALSDAVEATKKMFGAISKAANRSAESRKRNLELEQDRIKADLKTFIEEPFKILEDAANKVYQAWDNNIRLINGTQGYSKADLQDLMSEYSQRLRSEGLDEVMASTDVVDNLTKVLQAGLSGQAAEEFAYIATILNNAMPTYDFFGMVDDYTSMIGIATAAGKSQSEALEYASSQLQGFANNILYANRNLTGGFTTGLKDVSKILEDAVKISQYGQTDNISKISGILSSISSIVGSIAPDIASSIVDVVTQAATGGNSSELVALRSLAGVNASNTEFLSNLVNNPKRLLSDLFSGLSDMQNMSNGNQMELYEGLASLFGVSMDAFARVDFQYVADAISDMNLSSQALNENIKHLASGETTMSSEALRFAQVNAYMEEQGLAYVIDSQEARYIQQHMWDEQMAREMMEASYGVELQGSALEFLESITSTIKNILGFLNPFMLLSKGIEALGSFAEASVQRADIAAVLNAVKVGNGRSEDFRNLVTTNKDLNLTGNLASVINGGSLYGLASRARSKAANNLSGGILTTESAFSQLPITKVLGSSLTRMDEMYHMASGLVGGISDIVTGGRKGVYSWSSVPKSVIKDVAKMSSASIASGSTFSTKQASEDAAKERADKLLATKLQSATELMGDKKKNGDGKDTMKYESYDEWKAAAMKKVGKNNWEDAIEAAGTTESSLKDMFEQYQAKQGAEQQQERLNKEETFWDTLTLWFSQDPTREQEFEFWDVTMKYQIDQLSVTRKISELLESTTNKILSEMSKEIKSMHKDWTDYYIRYTTYGTGAGEYNAAGRKTYNYADVERVAQMNKDESYDALHALAEALSSNMVDLHDPQVQTNALLGKILLVIEAILQQNQSTDSGGSTFNTLTSLAKGLL